MDTSGNQQVTNNQSGPVLPVAPGRRRLPRLPRLQRRQLGWLLGSCLAVVSAVLLYIYAYLPTQPTGIFRQALTSTLEQESTNFRLAVSGPATVNLEGAAGSGGVYRLDGSYATAEGKLDISALSDGKDMYVRFGNLQQLGLLLGEGAAAYGINPDSNPFQALDGKWLVVPANVSQSLLQSAGANAAASQGLNEADRQKLVDLYRRHEFLRVYKALADETVDNTPSRHYQIAVDKDRLQAFLKAAQRDVKDLKLTDDQIDSIVGMEGLAKPFDLWISKTSGLVKQIAFVGGTDKDALQMRVTFLSYGQPVKADKPQDARPLLDALTGSMMGNLPQ